MYWLLPAERQEKIRTKIDHLVRELSNITDNPQLDQYFPFVGRKDRRKAEIVVNCLSNPGDSILDPFAGSGSIVYAIEQAGRNGLGNDWEPYTSRMAAAPWRIPQKNELDAAIKEIDRLVRSDINFLYKTICTCGHIHVLDSLFFDRVPLKFHGITNHERLGPNGENVTYRGKYKCPSCKRTEKEFDSTDAAHMAEIQSHKFLSLFSTPLIENSRINLSSDFKVYGDLFPHRSKVALSLIWNAIAAITTSDMCRMFLQDAFLSIIPQAKFKDYRSKSQDLHCPNVMLREVNIYYRFIDQVNLRFEGLKKFSFADSDIALAKSKISCKDFREYLALQPEKSVPLLFTDPPWNDGNPYFEKAQLYHPWIGFNLQQDASRLENELVVTDAPSRKATKNQDDWWTGIGDFFTQSHNTLVDEGLLVLFFRPIPAARWLENLNKLKLIARRAGFEPLLTIDVHSSDPSMRIQQSASYVFSADIMFLFLKVPENTRRSFVGDNDLDRVAYLVGDKLQEATGPFTFKEWRDALSAWLKDSLLPQLDASSYDSIWALLFTRYFEKVVGHGCLPRHNTPFSGLVFDTPLTERLFSYVPAVIEELTAGGQEFTYEQFLLRLATFVENGTRSLINDVAEIDIKRIIRPYAEQGHRPKWFKRRDLPALPGGLTSILSLDPYKFEEFVAHLFKNMGYTRIALLGRSGDRGVDIAAIDADRKSVVIQCKRYWGHKVDATPIQRLHSFSISRKAARTILVTTSEFTRDAIDEAKKTKTDLIDGKALEKLIARHMPQNIEIILQQEQRYGEND